MNDFLTIGQIINTHGIKGELKVYPLCDDINRFIDLKKVYIDNVERKVLRSRIQIDKVILKIEGIDTMNDAELYKKKYIDVLREDAVKPKKGGYYVSDIIGCSVYDDTGAYLGKINDVIKTKNNDAYQVEGMDVLIPAFKEIITKIDINEKKIIIRPVKTWYDED